MFLYLVAGRYEKNILKAGSPQLLRSGL